MDFFNRVDAILRGVASNIQMVGGAAVIICIVIIAIMFMAGERSSEKAKSWMIRVLVGAVLLWGAGALATFIQNQATF